MGRLNKLSLLSVAAAALVFAAVGYASTSQQDQDQSQQSKADAKKAAHDQKKREKDLYKELDNSYKKWLDEDVVYIISPEERSAFLHLTTNEEREQFIEAFWQRRNPDPDSPENTYKEEHYRRIAYANEHYASGIPGWKTDRGRIYIMWGPPDETDSHPSGGTYERPPEEGGGETTTYPFEDWRYRYLEGIGENVIIEFVDPTGSGEYHLTMDPSEKDALTYVPGAGLTMLEQMGLSSKTNRFNNTDGTHLGQPLGMQPESYNEFSRLELYTKIQQAPPVKYKDLEALSTSRIIKDQVPFQYRASDFLRITSDTVLVPITVQIPMRSLTFKEASGVDTANVNLFVRITSMTGRIIQTFEEPLTDATPNSLLQQSMTHSLIFQKAVPLSPGLYRMDIVLKDTNSNNVGVKNVRLAVPRFQDDQLSASSLILADDIHPVSSHDIGLGQFVLGDMKVRPKLDSTFATTDPMGVFLQVYNLKVDQKTHKPDASVEFRVLPEKGTQALLQFDLPADRLPEHGEELTIANRLTLGSLTPGHYKLEIAVTDHLANQTITPTADFTVKAPPAQAAAAPSRSSGR
ncbi:MAG TPA: GWxTD domain-containing protein [Candidatus Acidoferrales bacterium]|nr:GWxTD domain-containing protein [Candidatus Acidoferrales bacterium]